MRIFFLISCVVCTEDCSISGVYITLSSVNAVEHRVNSSEKPTRGLYRIGFTSKGVCESDKLLLKIWLPDFIDKEVRLHKSRTYKAPEDSGVIYERFFYFFEISYETVMLSPCEFKYQIRHGTLESTVFEFQSKMFCSKYYRVIALGQHDNSKIGSRLIQSAKWHTFDLLFLTGNYVTGYHLDNGRLGDEYFEAMQTLTSRMITLVIPGRRESFDNYRMFQSRFMMPGCGDVIGCDVVYVADSKINLMLINFDKVLRHNRTDQLVENALLSEIMAADAKIGKYDESFRWKVVFSNSDFYCSQNDLQSNCLVDHYKLKPFEDLFDLLNIHLVVSSGRKIYESVRDVFNYALRPESQPRNYVVSGLAGCTNYLTTNDIEFKPDLSFTGHIQQQAVFTMDVLQGYYKMDLLKVPDFTSLDLRFVRYTFDWDKFILYLFFFVGMVILFGLFHFNRPRVMGTNLAMGRHILSQILQPRPKSELQEDLLKEVARIEDQVEVQIQLERELNEGADKQAKGLPGLTINKNEWEEAEDSEGPQMPTDRLGKSRPQNESQHSVHSNRDK